MNAFNDPKDIILYWDEPTITMDYSEDPIHSKIQENWTKNITLTLYYLQQLCQKNGKSKVVTGF